MLSQLKCNEGTQSLSSLILGFDSPFLLVQHVDRYVDLIQLLLD
jgi:hypothetical protein